MPRPVPALRRLAQIAGAVLVLAVTGCGVGEPRSIGPAGVDGLEIPTPSPDPADFVATIDNPWLPLMEGSEWVYEHTLTGAETATITVAVTGTTTTIDGVVATAVTTVVEGPRADTKTAWFAQDRDGNVWSFGANDWQAGVDGARAGLVMPATPRVGDGFVQQYAAGVAEDRSEVLDVAASAAAPYGSWTDLVEIRETTPLATGVETSRFYAADVGLVRTESTDGITALVSYTP